MPTIARLALIAALVLAAERGSLAQTDEQPTYVPSVTTKSRKPLRWMGSNCVLVRPNAKGSPDIDDGSDLAAIERSVEDWHAAVKDCSYIRIELQEPSDSAVPGYNKGGENENVIFWVVGKWPHDPAAAGITAVSYVGDPTREDDGRILDADIELNGHLRFSSSGEANKTDIENTVVHELGHLFGLDHTCDDGVRRPVPQDNTGKTIPSCVPRDQLSPNVTEATMFNSAPAGETKKRTPEAGDILGICETYPIADDPGQCVPVEPQVIGRGCATVDPERHHRSTPLALVLIVLVGLRVVAGHRPRRLRSAA